MATTGNEKNYGSGTNIKRISDNINGYTENKRRRKESNNEPEDEYEHPIMIKNYFKKLPFQIRPFAYAASSGDLKALRRFFEPLDSDIDERTDLMDIDDQMDNYGRTLLHMVCENGHLSCAKFLLERGASLEKFDAYERIPLHYACHRGHKEVVRLILAHAKEPGVLRRMLDTVDEEWQTPLHTAARFGRVDVARLLVAHGASPDKATDVYGKTPNYYYDLK